MGLPLQRSLFGRLDEAADLLGVAHALPEGRFEARVDEDGDLFVDRASVLLVEEALGVRLRQGNLLALEGRHRERCEALVRTTDLAHRSGASLHGSDIRAALRDLGDRIADILPYGILSKFVPDLILRALSERGAPGPTPFPDPSPGAELSADLWRLRRRCASEGYGPARLMADWPGVDAPVKAMVRGFCLRQTGFGPLPWEAPGFEDPVYVIGAMAAAFPEGEPPSIRLKGGPGASPGTPRGTGGAADPSRHVHELHQLLAFWLEFLELETWHVRRAFYIGVAPLIRRLFEELAAGEPSLVPEDLFFLTIEELTADSPGAGRVEITRTRRATHAADTAYRERYGIQPGRLHALGAGDGD
ncbi:MAG: hypothetical protein H0W27_01720 [Actinobacteria bacterium]|nr:hypothetical protein [Actinomycetota bacterium]